MNPAPYKKTLIQPFILLIILLIFGCDRTRETRLLIVSSKESKDNLVNTEIARFALSSNFLLKKSPNLTSVNEDTLKLYSVVFFDNIGLNDLSYFQINALERYVDSGGNVVIIDPTDTSYNQYKWPVFSKFLSGLLPPANPLNADLMSEKFGKGQVVVVKLESLEPEGQKGLISKAIAQVVADEVSLEYRKVATSRVPPEHWFEIDTLAMSFNEPIEMEVLKNGDVLIIERKGNIKIFDSNKRSIKTIAQLPVVSSQSNGISGIALDPDFENTGWIFFSYTPQANPGHHRISRFKIIEDSLAINSEQILFEHSVTITNGWHGINAIEFDSNGNLYFAIGDFTIQTGEVAGYGQIDERNSSNDSQTTSSNSNNLLGKISRIHPEKDGTYTIPEGNLFQKKDSLARPEIYIMGCRNPYRFTLDSKTDVLYFGDVGPDAWKDGEKGPKGYDELNIAGSSGYYGWPYVIADNKPYRDFNYSSNTLGTFFDPDNLINKSPNNTGKKKLMPAREAILWYPKGKSQDFPYLGTGGMNIMIGPKYYLDDFKQSNIRFPSHYNEKLFIYDWVRNWINVLELDENHKLVRIEPFLSTHKFNKIIDMKFGDDGTLYLLEYGSSGYKPNADASLKRIRYAEGKPKLKPMEDPQAENLDGTPTIKKEHTEVWKLMKSHNCMSCHQVDKKIVGPSFKDVAQHYANVDSAQTYLPKKIIDGGTGNWIGNIAMPANPLLTEDQAKDISRFILGLDY
ncbi:MAG: PQQ-dependent sugar dehydrogenase [Cyclobacteriaceae bacterium]